MSTTDYTQLITRLLLSELLSPSTNTPTGTRRSRTNSAIPREQTPNSSVIALTDIMRTYNQTISDYNMNISHYNQNVERIVGALETIIAISPVSRNGNTRVNSTTSDVFTNPTSPEIPTPGIDLSFNTTYNVPYDNDEPSTVNSNQPTRTLRYNSNTHVTGNSSSSHIGTIPSNVRSTIYNTGYTNNLYSTLIRNIMQYRNTNNIALTREQLQRVTEECVYNSSIENTPTQCPISLDEFVEGENILKIRKCGHIFRPAELRRWFTQRNKCPVCRCNVLDISSSTIPTTHNTEQPNAFSADDEPSMENTLTSRPMTASSHYGVIPNDVSDDEMASYDNDIHIPNNLPNIILHSEIDDETPLSHNDNSSPETPEETIYPYIIEFSLRY
jgi:hypothetical protein